MAKNKGPQNVTKEPETIKEETTPVVALTPEQEKAAVVAMGNALKLRDEIDALKEKQAELQARFSQECEVLYKAYPNGEIETNRGIICPSKGESSYFLRLLKPKAKVTMSVG